MPSTYSIAVLGDAFSFHHLAAIAAYGADQKFIFCSTFDGLLEKMQSGETDFCLMAVENSIAGEVPGNFQRITDHHLFISRELILHISLCLGALPGISLHQLNKVYSHQMGRRECTGFFKENPHLEFVQTNSTATGAKMIADEQLRDAGAITSKTALQYYGLTVIEEGIDDHSGNYTRFFALGRNSIRPETTNKILKASMVLQIYDNQPGSSFDSIMREVKVLMKKELHENKIYLEAAFTQISHFDQFLQTIPHDLCKIVVAGIYEPGRIIEGL